MTTSLSGAPVAEAILAATLAQVRARAGGASHPPTLASVHRAETGPFAVYLRNQARTAEKAGVRFRPVSLAPHATADDLVRTVRSLSEDDEVDGVLLEHPLPTALDFPRAIGALDPVKDVDGVGPTNLGRLVSRHPLHVPAVADAALRIVRHYGIATAGRRVAVIGRSETVGLPLALLLLDRGENGDATVTVLHSRTPQLGPALDGSEVIFSCAGAPGLLTKDVVPRSAAIVDVGLSTVADASRPSGVRMVGDADPVSLDGWAGALSPVPGGVGPVTVACLMASVVRAWRARAGEAL